jgi:hypothetical protein
MQVLAVFVGQAGERGKQQKGAATNFAVWTRDTKVRSLYFRTETILLPYYYGKF